jgi:hypothetical protein
VSCSTKAAAIKSDRIDLDLTHAHLSKGVLCDDGQWRQIVTVEDALSGGCNLFDLDQLKLEYSPAEYENLLMCEFVDDQASVFPFAELQGCMVDSLDEWEDFDPYLRPFAYRPVWIGYDPSHTGDSAGCAVIAPPWWFPAANSACSSVTSGKVWTLPRRPKASRTSQIVCVEYIGIDATGIGQGVFQLVQQFFPAAREIRYSPEVKTAWY